MIGRSADNMREAAMGKVDRYDLVQGVCGFQSFDRSYVTPEGQALFLLMEAAWRGSGGASLGRG